MIILIQFILAHIIGDFFLQRDTWVHHKDQKKLRSIYLYIHVIIHFLLLLIVTGNILFWKADNLLWKQVISISVLHLFIDGIKLKFQTPKTKSVFFFIDQAAHITSIILVWALAEKIQINWDALSNKKILVPVTAIIFLLRPTSFIIRNIVSQWASEDKNSLNVAHSTSKTDTESLKNAGQLIGMLERLLVLAFILLNKWEGVGFLLAAKSVFRFGDLKEAKDMKLTEYILIGTLLSFGIAVAIGVITIELLK
ncbi:DUF3307 domain-containing protein [uncultured Chitinophaga sp.]|uniref:DUF3307 domain-containing protein n=1 Tax=uncultured Chitinophaga sp. TaxID=339340 RepID=UPI0025DA4104|nr:DUF3307 domain-containing protein [uncultured Chitinophaga sp.]